MRRLLAASCLAGAVAGCGHAAAVVDGVLEKGGVRVQLGPVPEGWAQVHVDGADLAYRDQGFGGSAMVDFRCHEPDDDAPLGTLTQHLIMGTTDRQTVSEETIPFDGREAKHTVMLAKLDGVDLEYDIYVMKKDGCVFDLVYVTPPRSYGDAAPSFERFARGLHATTPPVDVGHIPSRGSSPTTRDVGGARASTSAAP
jgi:hypothetical protein